MAGLDLSNGDLVGLAFVAAADGPEALAARIDRWNALAMPGCPRVRELRSHLGRPLVAYELLSAGALAERSESARSELVERCAALGEALGEAELGLPTGPADLALERAGPVLRRPAIWRHDPERPLPTALAERASQAIARVPLPAGVPATAGRRRTALVRRLPESRRARLALVVACGLLSAALASGLARPTHPSALVRARTAPAAPVAGGAVRPVSRPVAARAARRPPTSRGGPARLLLRVRPLARRAPAPEPARAATPPTARVTATPGWVGGLFVGS